MALFNRRKNKDLNPYLYSDTGLLKNRYGIRKNKELLKEFVDRKATENMRRGGIVDFEGSYEDFKRLHHMLYWQSYEWAGKDRSEPFAFDGEKEFQLPDQPIFPETFETKPYEYPSSKDVNELGHEFFNHHIDRLEQNKKEGTLSKEKMAQSLAFLAINSCDSLRPFQDGNERTAQYYMSLMAEKYGFKLNIEERFSDFKSAVNADHSFNGAHLPVVGIIEDSLTDLRDKDYSYDQLSADNALGNQRISATFNERSEEKGHVETVQPEEKQEQAKPEKTPANDEKEPKPHALLFKDERIHNIADEIKVHIDEHGKYNDFYQSRAGQFAADNPDFSKDDAEKALWGVFAQRNDNQTMYDYLQHVRDNAEIKPKGETKDEDKKLSSILDQTENPKETMDNLKLIARLNVAKASLEKEEMPEDRITNPEGDRKFLSDKKAEYLTLALISSQNDFDAKTGHLDDEDRDYLRGHIEKDIEQLQKEPDQQTQSLSNPYEFKESKDPPTPPNTNTNTKDQENEGR